MNKKLAISLVILTLVATVSAGRKGKRKISDRLSPSQLTSLNLFYGKAGVEQMSANQQRRLFIALQGATLEERGATQARHRNKRK